MIEINETFFYQLVNFLVMVVFLNHFLFKPILEIVDRRSKKMRSLESDIKKSQAGAEKAIEKYESKMDEMKKTTAGILVEARQAASTEQEKIISKARTEFTEQVEEAKKDIEKQRSEAAEKLRADAEGISQQMASRLLGRKI